MKRLTKSFSFYALLLVCVVGVLPSRLGYSSYVFSEGLFSTPINGGLVDTVTILSILGFAIGYTSKSRRFKFESWLLQAAFTLDSKVRKSAILDWILILLFSINCMSIVQIYYTTSFSLEEIQAARFDVFLWPSLSTFSALVSALLMPCVLAKSKLSSFAFAIASIAPSVLSLSRSGALHAILIAISYYLFGAKLESLLFLALSILGYQSAILFRTDPTTSVETFTDSLSLDHLQLMLGDIPNLIGLDMASSISSAAMIESSFGLKEALLLPIRLFQIFQPFPIGLFPIRPRFDSLSFHYSNNLSVGINSDMLSEPVLMLGVAGSLIVWILLGFYFRFIDDFIQQTKSDGAYVINTALYVARFSFFALGCVANLVAATRPLSYVLLLIAASRLFRRKYADCG